MRVVHFIEVELPEVKWMSGCDEVLPEWKVFETRDAAWDAALMARIHLTSDLEVASEHRQHVSKRWDVWVRGYGLLCDVGGLLYVYKRV